MSSTAPGRENAFLSRVADSFQYCAGAVCFNNSGGTLKVLVIRHVDPADHHTDLTEGHPSIAEVRSTVKLPRVSVARKQSFSDAAVHAVLSKGGGNAEVIDRGFPTRLNPNVRSLSSGSDENPPPFFLTAKTKDIASVPVLKLVNWFLLEPARFGVWERPSPSERKPGLQREGEWMTVYTAFQCLDYDTDKRVLHEAIKCYHLPKRNR